MVDCPDTEVLRESKLERILTQYRESPRLLGMIRNYLKQIDGAMGFLCEVQNAFDIDTSVGEQLTYLGKIIGFPRCHCAGEVIPVYGFECVDDCYKGPPIVGFCDEGRFSTCPGPTHREYCFTDDDFYRKFLKARILALRSDYRRPNLSLAVQELFGTDADHIVDRAGYVTIWIGRAFTQEERKVIDLFKSVLPVAPGIKLKFAYGNGPIAGFGAGYEGFCTGNVVFI